MVQVNYASFEKSACHLAEWMERQLQQAGVENVQHCMEILLDSSSNCKIGPESTDPYICLEDKEENDDLCIALENSLQEMESSEIDIKGSQGDDNIPGEIKGEEVRNDTSQDKGKYPWSCPS